MPFCTSCGTQIGDADVFCAHCGRPQRAVPPPPVPEASPPAPEAQEPQAAPPSPPATKPAVAPNVAAMLCYIPHLGWIASVIFLVSEPYKQDRYVRFHAFQGLFLQAAAMVLRFIFPVPIPVFPFGRWSIRGILNLLILVAQVVGIIKTVQRQAYRLPVAGDLAEKSMA
jgi:uncharacterized membrane protein